MLVRNLQDLELMTPAGFRLAYGAKLTSGTLACPNLGAKSYKSNCLGPCTRDFMPQSGPKIRLGSTMNFYSKIVT